MSPLIPNAKNTRGFRSMQAFETWLARNHDRQDELWLRIYKKDSGIPTVTYAEALDVALCWGWIDGIRRAFDARSFVQRFSPRRAKSIWSQNNRAHVARLTAAGRMTPHGQRHVDAAKADGRWDKAYAPARSLTAADLPADLRRAIAANPRAQERFRTLGRRDLFALAFRTTSLKTPAVRARKIAALVDLLARGTPLQPGSARRDTSPDEPLPDARCRFDVSTDEGPSLDVALRLSRIDRATVCCCTGTGHPCNAARREFVIYSWSVSVNGVVLGTGTVTLPAAWDGGAASVDGDIRSPKGDARY